MVYLKQKHTHASCQIGEFVQSHPCKMCVYARVTFKLMLRLIALVRFVKKKKHASLYVTFRVYVCHVSVDVAPRCIGALREKRRNTLRCMLPFGSLFSYASVRCTYKARSFDNFASPRFGRWLRFPLHVALRKKINTFRYT